MDDKKLVEELRRHGLGNGTSLGRHMGLCDEAADRIEELTTQQKEAERKRMAAVELPRESIAARYDVADMLSDFKKEAEFSDQSVGINGITWAESALLTAIIDGLNVGRPPERNNEI